MRLFQKGYRLRKSGGSLLFGCIESFIGQRRHAEGLPEIADIAGVIAETAGECRKFAEDFYAAQFIDSAAGDGIVHMVNGAAATKGEFILKLKGLDAVASYRMTSAEEKRSWTATGAQLMEGFSVVLPKKSGDIWFFEKEE